MVTVQFKMKHFDFLIEGNFVNNIGTIFFKELDDHDQVVEPQEPNTVRSNKQPQDHSRNKGKRQSKKQR